MTEEEKNRDAGRLLREKNQAAKDLASYKIHAEKLAKEFGYMVKALDRKYKCRVNGPDGDLIFFENPQENVTPDQKFPFPKEDDFVETLSKIRDLEKFIEESEQRLKEV